MGERLGRLEHGLCIREDRGRVQGALGVGADLAPQPFGHLIVVMNKWLGVHLGSLALRGWSKRLAPDTKREEKISAQKPD